MRLNRGRHYGCMRIVQSHEDQLIKDGLFRDFAVVLRWVIGNG